MTTSRMVTVGVVAIGAWDFAMLFFFDILVAAKCKQHEEKS